MRYTTIIDITEVPQVWRSHAAVSIYLYMALRCGYHDDDRDVIRVSIRDLAWRLHLTISAVRHGLSVLLSSGMIVASGASTYKVLKWIDSQQPTKRKTRREKEMAHIAEQREQERQRQEAALQAEHQRIQALESQGLTSFDLRLQKLKEKADKGDTDALRKYEHLKKQRQ